MNHVRVAPIPRLAHIWGPEFMGGPDTPPNEQEEVEEEAASEEG